MSTRKTPLAIAAAAAVTVMATGSQAQVQATCADRDKVVDRLSTNFGETRQSLGLGANNSVMEVFASDETGTWTITVTMPNGQTCLLASGQAYEPLFEDKLAIPGEGA